MTLAYDRPLNFLGPVYTEKLPLSLDVYPISIFRGAPVIMDVSVDDSAVVPAEGVTVATGDVMIGIAAEQAVSNVGQTEPTQLEVYVWPTIVGFTTTDVDMADLGKAISMSDNDTLTTSGGAYPIIGTLYSVRGGVAYVLLNPPAIHS